jgi:hypothetical protein
VELVREVETTVLLVSQVAIFKETNVRVFVLEVSPLSTRSVLNVWKDVNPVTLEELVSVISVKKDSF